MRAAVVEALGGVPVVEEFADPTGDDVAEGVAAPVNPFDLIVAAGQMPARQPSRASKPTNCRLPRSDSRPVRGAWR